MRTPEAKEEQIQVSGLVDVEDVEALRDSAKANDRTFAAELRRAIRYYLEHGQ